VPGQVYYNASRKLILKGVDGIVFVADSQAWRGIRPEDHFGEELRQYRQVQGYADLLLVTAHGDVVYSVAKGSDLTQNLRHGDLAGSPLHKAFEKGLEILKLYKPSMRKSLAQAMSSRPSSLMSVARGIA